MALGLLLAASPARAAAEPERLEPLALHPCVVSGEKNKEKLQEYQTLCTTELSRVAVQWIPPEQVRAALDKEPKKACTAAKTQTECLGRLATATQAARSVLITLQPGPLTRVSGLVVGAQGSVLDQKNIQIRSRGEPQADLLRTAITRLLTQLPLVPPKAAAPVEPTKPPPAPIATTPPPTPEPTPSVDPSLLPAPQDTLVGAPVSPRTWKTPVAYGAAGAGVVALGLAGYLAFSGEQSMVQSNDFYKGRLPSQSELSRIVELRQQAHSQRTLAGVSTAVGAVLVGAGAYLWLWDRRVPPAASITAVSVGPGGVSLVGTLP